MLNRNLKEPCDEFIREFFTDEQEYQDYVEEFHKRNILEIRENHRNIYINLTDRDDMITITPELGRDIYTLIRKVRPSIMIETGVCHGFSTLSILSALYVNESGTLISIDYPYRIDESIEDFKEETYQDFGGAALPNNKQPGWIIPKKFKDQWKLVIGKSQRKLPEVMTSINKLDCFLHDSEHSHPCMMFEYELAHEWLKNDGILISDDINWNQAFSTFIEVRELRSGNIFPDVGYAVK